MRQEGHIINCIKAGKAPLMDEMASHRDMLIKTSLPNEFETILVIKENSTLPK